VVILAISRAATLLPTWDSRVTDADESVVISRWDGCFHVNTLASCGPTNGCAARRPPHQTAASQSRVYAHFHVTRDLLELRNLVQVAELIVLSCSPGKPWPALQRDYPELAATAEPTILTPPPPESH
jgi:L-aspartate oxidase